MRLQTVNLEKQEQAHRDMVPNQEHHLHANLALLSLFFSLVVFASWSQHDGQATPTKQQKLRAYDSNITFSDIPVTLETNHVAAVNATHQASQDTVSSSVEQPLFNKTTSTSQQVEPNAHNTSVFFNATTDFNATRKQMSPTHDGIESFNSSTERMQQVHGIDLLRRVHQSVRPAIEAGRWMYRPDRAIRPTDEHLQCLDMERQGNCHNMTECRLSNDKAKLSRVSAVERGAIRNSPGILDANDPWVWESDFDEYKVLPTDDANVIRQIVGNSQFYLIGDSLTRQWSQVMTCEFTHRLSIERLQPRQRPGVYYLQEHTEFPKQSRLTTFLCNATENDYVVFNLGHHIDPAKMGDQWSIAYRQALEMALTANYGLIPSSHVFFRTTSVRHYLRGLGDFDQSSSSAGGVEPNMTAEWSLYGGNYPVQPAQNLLALEILGNTTKIGGILDTSPLMLARGDASFDGSHFCLPGPMEYWSRMLYYRIAKLKKNKATTKS